MSLIPVLRYSLDLSGVSSNNLVIGELHSLPPVAPNRSIAPQYGSFYTAGLKVRDVGGTLDAVAYVNVPLTGTSPLIINGISLGDNPVGYKRVRLTNQDNPVQNGFYQYTVSGGFYTMSPMALGPLLVPGADYVCTMLQQDATRVSGKEVCQIIVITNPTLMNDVVLEYQAVGGEYSVSSDALEQLIEALNLDNRPVVWGEIIGLPNAFPPVQHLHHIEDFKGFGHLVDVLDDISSMLSGELSYTPGGGSGGGLTIHVGTAPPATPVEKQLWWNNETLRLFLYYADAGGNVWVEISGSGGTGTGASVSTDISSAVYPAKALPLTFPDYTYIGEIAEAGDSTANDIVVLNVEGPIDTNNGDGNFSGQLIFNRVNGTSIFKVMTGEISQNPFKYFYDTGSNRYIIYMSNTTARSSFIIWTANNADVILSNAEPDYTIPGGIVETFLITQERLITETDITGMCNAIALMFDNVSGYFETHSRVILAVPPGP